MSLTDADRKVIAELSEVRDALGDAATWSDAVAVQNAIRERRRAENERVRAEAERAVIESLRIAGWKR